MRIRATLTAVLLLTLLVPGATQAGGGRLAATRYLRTESALGSGARAVVESISFDGTALTSGMRQADDWAALAIRGIRRVDVQAPTDGGPAAATSYKVIGRRYTAYNGIGWVVLQYTVWQEFGYTGSAITWYASPYFDAQANWGWELRSHAESAAWVTYPTYRRSRGDFFFKQSFWTPGGNNNQSELNGWVALYYRANGSWTATNF